MSLGFAGSHTCSTDKTNFLGFEVVDIEVVELDYLALYCFTINACSVVLVSSCSLSQASRVLEAAPLGAHLSPIPIPSRPYWTL